MILLRDINSKLGSKSFVVALILAPISSILEALVVLSAYVVIYSLSIPLSENNTTYAKYLSLVNQKTVLTPEVVVFCSFVFFCFLYFVASYIYYAYVSHYQSEYIRIWRESIIKKINIFNMGKL